MLIFGLRGRAAHGVPAVLGLPPHYWLAKALPMLLFISVNLTVFPVNFLGLADILATPARLCFRVP